MVPIGKFETTAQCQVAFPEIKKRILLKNIRLDTDYKILNRFAHIFPEFLVYLMKHGQATCAGRWRAPTPILHTLKSKKIKTVPKLSSSFTGDEDQADQANQSYNYASTNSNAQASSANNEEYGGQLTDENGNAYFRSASNSKASAESDSNAYSFNSGKLWLFKIPYTVYLTLETNILNYFIYLQ